MLIYNCIIIHFYKALEYTLIVSKFRSSRGTVFKKKLRRRNDGWYEVAVPPYVVERENLKKGDVVRWKVEEIQEDD